MRERERERMSACVCVCAHLCMCVCERAREKERERERVAWSISASPALSEAPKLSIPSHSFEPTGAKRRQERDFFPAQKKLGRNATLVPPLVDI